MKLTPWDKRDSREALKTIKVILDMVIAGSFAGLVVNPLSLSLTVFSGLLVATMVSFSLPYFLRRL